MNRGRCAPNLRATYYHSLKFTNSTIYMLINSELPLLVLYCLYLLFGLHITFITFHKFKVISYLIFFNGYGSGIQLPVKRFIPNPSWFASGRASGHATFDAALLTIGLEIRLQFN